MPRVKLPKPKVLTPTRNESPSTVVIFDGDDTLWPNQIFYDRAIRRFTSLMRRLGFHRDAAEKLFEKTDRGNVARFGYSRNRFPTSMEDTYRSLCREHAETPKRSIVSQVRRIGRDVFRTKPKLNVGAARALEQLSARFKLVLFTSGDEKVQRQKIRTLGLDNQFGRVRIVPVKTALEFRNLLAHERVRPEDAIMIGNSLRSDILPAQEVGITTILFLARTWHYENSVLVDHSLPKVRKFSRLPLIVSRLARANRPNERP